MLTVTKELHLPITDEEVADRRTAWVVGLHENAGSECRHLRIAIPTPARGDVLSIGCDEHAVHGFAAFAYEAQPLVLAVLHLKQFGTHI